MNTIAHIINPFKADEKSDLFIAQPITFQSILNAKKKADGIVKVELFSAQYKSEGDHLPSGFVRTPDLDKSVLDNHCFQKKVMFPILIDILGRLYHASDAEYLIYSNVDIGLYPDFYTEVNKIIEQGYDAFLINRRRLPAVYSSPRDLEDIYKNKGKSHPGFDCFVFHRTLFPKLKLEGICIGVPFIEISFSQNLFAYGNKVRIFDDVFLTFHIGEEIFKKRAPREYYRHNQKQFWNLVPQLGEALDIKKFPYSNYFWPYRIIKWGLHPCIPIRLVVKLEWARIRRWATMIV